MRAWVHGVASSRTSVQDRQQHRADCHIVLPALHPQAPAQGPAAAAAGRRHVAPAGRHGSCRLGQHRQRRLQPRGNSAPHTAVPAICVPRPELQGDTLGMRCARVQCSAQQPCTMPLVAPAPSEHPRALPVLLQGCGRTQHAPVWRRLVWRPPGQGLPGRAAVRRRSGGRRSGAAWRIVAAAGARRRVRHDHVRCGWGVLCADAAAAATRMQPTASHPPAPLTLTAPSPPSAAAPASRLPFLRQPCTPWRALLTYEVGQQGALAGPWDCCTPDGEAAARALPCMAYSHLAYVMVKG